MALLLFMTLLVVAYEAANRKRDCAHESYPFITLHYGTERDARSIEHNCVLARRAGASMRVYTTMPTSGYCGACQCERFVPTGCRAPSRNKNLCEKLHFVARAVLRLGAFVYLDSDVVVTRALFFRALELRAGAHDFLAAYVHRARREAPRYRNRFNSGVFFMRRLRHLNYSTMVPRMYQLDTGNDQSVLSEFVLRHYANWDALSVRFNCRGILRFKDDVPPRDCLAIHDRSEQRELMRMLNLSLNSVV